MMTKDSNGRVRVANRVAGQALQIKCYEPLDYRRGVRHGLQAAASVVAQYDRGRSWTGGHMAEMIDKLTDDVALTCARIGEVLNDEDDVPLLADLTILPRATPKRATIRAKKKRVHPPTPTR